MMSCTNARYSKRTNAFNLRGSAKYMDYIDLRVGELGVSIQCGESAC